MKNTGRTVTLLGSTGSIGTQALEVIESLGMRVGVLTACKNASLLEMQCRKFKPETAYIDESLYASFKASLADTSVKVVTGKDSLCEAASYEKSDIVLNSLLGISGLRPTAAALKAKKNVALANKETLVTGGNLITSLARENGASLIPVDSEHSAIFQCLCGQQRPKKLILTASGGAFYDLTKDQLKAVTPEKALRHPTWRMGAKITVDCATLINKGFEYIEAAHFFGVPEDGIEIIVHRESIVHSMVMFADGSVIAQLGAHDMRLPIQYALTYPLRTACIADKLDLASVGTLRFEKVDYSRFPLLREAISAYAAGGNRTAALNGADEECVRLFLDGKTDYIRMQEIICESAQKCNYIARPSFEDIEQTDLQAREFVREALDR